MKVVTFFGILQPTFILIFSILERDQELTLIDLIYFCAITSATVGFGDLSPSTQEGKAITAVYVLISTVLLVQVIQIYFSNIKPEKEEN
jgi:hypothetical protein